MPDMSDLYAEVMNDARHGGTLATELFQLIVGKPLGKGVSRKVFVSEMNRRQVVKFELTSGRYCNVMEWDIWQNLGDEKLGQWLAPCRAISPCGLILIQERTDPVKLSDMPEKIPRLFADTKLANWGWYEGRVVCHDYGNNMLYRGGNLSQLVKAGWWGQDY